MQINNKNSSLEKFFAKCKHHNLKITPQRIAIYKVIASSSEHPTADMVYQAIRKDFPNVSFDTVNRTLWTFSEIGLIDIVESYSGARRFDPKLDNHHHIHCIRCGDMIDFDNPEFDSLRLPPELERDNTIINKRVIVNVICAKCRQDQ